MATYTVLGVAAVTIGRVDEFVPRDFDVPRRLETPQFVLEPLGPDHNEQDYDAWTSSMDHIAATPGWGDSRWPREMTPEENRADLQRHADDFRNRTGFTYTVLDPANREVIGCVYIYPSRDTDDDARALSWVRASDAVLDLPLWRPSATGSRPTGRSTASNTHRARRRGATGAALRRSWRDLRRPSGARRRQRQACSVHGVTRFVIDCDTLLRIAAGEIEVAAEHQLVAPTLVRSQALSALYEAARRGEISAVEGLERVTRINSLKIRFLGDKVLQRQAWKSQTTWGGRQRTTPNTSR